MAVHRSIATVRPPTAAIRDAQLEPQAASLDRHGLDRVRHAQVGAPEHVNEIEWARLV